MSLLKGTIRRFADLVGRESWIVRLLRPAYQGLLGLVAGDRGILWTINGVEYRVDPRYRHQLGETYDAHLAEWFAARVRPGQTLLDIGANIGIYVLQFARWSPRGHVVAVEPNPSSRAVLERHVRMNGLAGRTTILPVAVGATAGEAELFTADTDGMARLGAPNPELGVATSSVVVPVVTVDELCAARQLTPDWVLMDIEGFEIAALRGARGLLAKADRVGLVIEMHPDAWDVAGTNRADFERLLAESGLRAESLSGQSDPLGSWGHVWLRRA